MADDAEAKASETRPVTRPRGRLGLFLPYILLLLIALLWSGGWFWIRSRTVQEMDAWTAREAAAGRTWTCDERAVSGYPFRLELRCAKLSLARADGGFTLGPVTAVAQIYAPRHVILLTAGPFHTVQGDLVGDVSWSRLEASFHATSDSFSRADLVVDGAKGRVTGADPQPIDFSTNHIELHARPNPGRFASEGAVDISLQTTGAVIPQLDALAGSREPADISLDAVLEQASVIGTGTLARELEKWRRADGRLDLTQLSISKGPQRLRAKGEAGIDEGHRLTGDFEVRAAGIEDLVGGIMGERFGRQRGALIGNLVGQLLGGLQRGGDPDAVERETNGADPSLKALPPLRLAGGRLMLGPFPIPNVALPPLY